MGELLKAVLRDASVQAFPRVYTAATPFLTNATTPTYLKPDPLVITTSDDSYFLVEKWGVLTSGMTIALTTVRTILTDNAVVGQFGNISLFNPLTGYEYFYQPVTTAFVTGLPAAIFPGILNDTDNSEDYILLEPQQKLGVRLTVTNLFASQVSYGAFFTGTEFKFASPPNMAQIRAQALAYEPATVSTRPLAIPPTGHVRSRPLAPIREHGSAVSQRAQLRHQLTELQAQQHALASAGHSPELNARRTAVRNQIATIRAQLTKLSATNTP